MEYKNHKKLVSEIFYAALQAVNPYESVKRYTDRIRSTFQNFRYNRLIVIGFGKASCTMSKSIEDNLADMIDTGIVITKYGHCKDKLKKFIIYEAGHPVPDENGLRGTEEIVRLVKDADENTLVVCLISGGGSALLVSPHEGITLDEKKKTTELLLKSGATISELNTVRKHISKVKGGRLAELAYPAKVIALILSDVIGDRLDVIASGPTSPDNTTYHDTLQVLEKYQLTYTVPERIIEFLVSGSKGVVPETPKEGNKLFERVENIIIGSNRIALAAAKERADSLGFHTEIISQEISGEARDVGRWLAQITKEKIRYLPHLLCLISGGETTVTVKGNGKGGRNMELALSFAMETEGVHGITLLSAGTDGTDGPTDAAGAVVDGETAGKARDLGTNPEEYLRNNDSYNFFKRIDELFITGPTGTNVMDIQIILVGSQ
jgi:hydroxypyruvate reductase/glycerate 2-kinase